MRIFSERKTTLVCLHDDECRAGISDRHSPHEFPTSTFWRNYVFHMEGREGKLHDYVNAKALAARAVQQNVPASVRVQAAKEMVALYDLDRHSARLVKAVAENKHTLISLPGPFLRDRQDQAQLEDSGRILEIPHKWKTYLVEILPSQTESFDYRNAKQMLEIARQKNVPRPVRQTVANRMIESYNFGDWQKDALVRMAG